MTWFPCCINLLARASILRKVTILSISLNNRQQKQIVRNLFEQTLTSYSWPQKISFNGYFHCCCEVCRRVLELTSLIKSPSTIFFHRHAYYKIREQIFRTCLFSFLPSEGWRSIHIFGKCLLSISVYLSNWLAVKHQFTYSSVYWNYPKVPRC